MRNYYKGTSDQALAWANDHMMRQLECEAEAEKYDSSLEALQELTSILNNIEYRLERGTDRSINDAHSDLSYAYNAFEAFRIKLESEWYSKVMTEKDFK